MRSICVLVIFTGLLSAQSQPSKQTSQATAESARATKPTSETPEKVSSTGNTVTVPSGTKIPLSLKQAISTKSTREGDPVYAETAFPVTLDGRLAIPAGTYVQGVITHIKRAGRIKGRAEVLMHFTTLIFPNGYTVVMPGAVENVPGTEKQKIKGEEGTIQQEGQTGEKVGTAASTAASGALIGGLSQGGKGAAIGAGIGGAAGLAIGMLTRGTDVHLDAGTSVEMVMQRPLDLDETRVHAPAR